MKKRKNHTSTNNAIMQVGVVFLILAAIALVAYAVKFYTY